MGETDVDGQPTTLPQRVPVATALDLTAQAADLLFANGQTTERTGKAVERLAAAFGYRAVALQQWGQLTVRLSDGADTHDVVATIAPTAVDMGKVAATLRMIDDVSDGRLGAVAVRTELERIRTSRPASTVRFAVMAAAGAAALAVIFGATDLLSLVLIAASAGAGAFLRRALGRLSHNPLIQPLSAALLAGVVGAIVVDFNLGVAQQLVAVCPCMILVPGPHLLNGAIDLARTRVTLGAARILFASLLILMICAGLLTGLTLGGVTLPVSGSSNAVPLAYDVLSAGVAVAAYGTFFSMPWKMLPIPVLIGMLAHAARWVAVSAAGLSAEVGALVACLVVGIIVTPITDRLRLPFASVAFASVVSLIPGVFLFRMSSGLASLITLGEAAPSSVLKGIIVDGATAFMIMLAMAFGLIMPKMCIEHYFPRLLAQDGPPSR